VVAAFVNALRDPVIAMRQRGAEGLKEIADASAVPALLEALRDEDNVVRFDARDALAKALDVSAIPTLFKLLEEASDKETVARLLIGLKGEVVVNHMIALLKSEDVDLRAVAVYALGDLGDRTAVPALLQSLKDEEERVRRLSAHSLRELKDPVAVPDLIAVLHDENEFDDVIDAAAWALNAIGTREARIAYKEWTRRNKDS
jgi:HEAT repeat protein